MSAILVIALSLLLTGTLATLIIAWYRPKYATTSATVVVLLTLALWLVMKLSLPHHLVLVSGTGDEQLPFWSLHVDSIAWHSSFYLMLLVLAMLLVSQARLDGRRVTHAWSLALRFGPSAGLFLLTATLLAIWAGSLYALLQGWMLLVLAWLLLLTTSEEARQAIGTVVFRVATLLLSLLFLWLAAVSVPDAHEAALSTADWPSPVRTWLLLAAIVQLGALPLQWWRPFAWSFEQPTGALTHIAPAVVGGTLLARPVLSGVDGSDYDQILTMFGLLGLFFGAALAWSHIGHPKLMAASLALGQTGAVLLVGAWTETEAVLAETRILTLAAGGLFLANSAPKARTTWYTIALAAAMAGFPLTAGFLGLAMLYNTWLTDGRVLLVLITALLYVPIVASVLLIGVGPEQPRDNRSLTSRGRLLHGLGLAIPILGLIALPATPVAQVHLIAWLAIFLSAVGGVVLAWRLGQFPEARRVLRGALQPDLPGQHIQRIYHSITASVETVIREVATILEGEGGMLWVLVLLVVLWLARQGQ